MPDLIDELAPDVSAAEVAAAAELDAQIDGGPVDSVDPELTPEPKVDAPVTDNDPEPSDERDYEEEAREMGWKPKDEFKGDPDKHRDARTFVELADNDPASLRNKVVKLQRENEDFQRRTTAATKAEIKRNVEASEARNRQQIADLERQRDALIDEYAGDAGAIKRINQGFEVETQKVAQPLPKETAEWVAERPHYHTDTIFRSAAFAVAQDNLHLTSSEQLAKIDEELAPRFPEYYDRPKPDLEPKPTNGAPPANSRTIEGVRPAARNRSAYDGLPSAAKSMYAMLKEEGIAPSKDEFAKDYQDA